MGPVLVAIGTEIVGIGFSVQAPLFRLNNLIIQPIPCTERNGVIPGVKPHFELIMGIALTDPPHQGVVGDLSTRLKFDHPVFGPAPTGLHGILTRLIDTNCGHGEIFPVNCHSELAARLRMRQVANLPPEC